ncbi:hypothetical protein Sjap_003055 [Stephania japonica]|uniref:Uncharacterized protein n=1 Tax=Stephania japonica TaxID=461633 RepID=A0AAP0PUQ0_9MAGN
MKNETEEEGFDNSELGSTTRIDQLPKLRCPGRVILAFLEFKLLLIKQGGLNISTNTLSACISIGIYEASKHYGYKNFHGKEATIDFGPESNGIATLVIFSSSHDIFLLCNIYTA